MGQTIRCFAVYGSSEHCPIDSAVRLCRPRRMEVEFLSARPPQLGKKQTVFALHGPDASSDLHMVRTLDALTTSYPPLLPALLEPPPTADGGRSEEDPLAGRSADIETDGPHDLAAEAAHAAAAKFALNEEQAGVLLAAAAWFKGPEVEARLPLSSNPCMWNLHLHMLLLNA